MRRDRRTPEKPTDRPTDGPSSEDRRGLVWDSQSVSPFVRSLVSQIGDCCSADPQSGVAPGLTRGRNVRSRYRCSMCPAIHINSRSWLRSSSTREPSDPPLRVVIFVSFLGFERFGVCVFGWRRPPLYTTRRRGRSPCLVRGLVYRGGLGRLDHDERRPPS